MPLAIFQVVGGNVDPKPAVKCIVCGGPHTKLVNCKRLPLYVPGDKFLKLPRGVCKSCLYCGTATRYPNCHKGSKKWICAASKLNTLICSECPVVHKDVQAFFKAHHNGNLTIKENFALFSQTQKPRCVTTNNIQTQLSKNVTPNQYPIGKTTCLSEVINIKLKDGSIFRA